MNSSISYATIGKFCSIGPNMVCGWGIHPLQGISTSPVFYSTLKQVGYTYAEANLVDERKPITIGNDVFIGANVTILDGVTIGDGAVIGAGAVVNIDIPAYAVAVGCPIKIIKYRFSDDIIKKLLQLQWWNKEDDYLKKLCPNFFDVESIIEERA
ncbi:CatB-related O-acetyltransferase [Flavobacterium xinjiangense]|nr:CatB-related O-acetyltransferase [Flavobacterium xinjiangense]